MKRGVGGRSLPYINFFSELQYKFDHIPFEVNFFWSVTHLVITQFVGNTLEKIGIFHVNIATSERGGGVIYLVQLYFVFIHRMNEY